MNIINKVTLKMLIKNKVRTIVTIIGIILSASMICAVSVLGSSLQNYMIENSSYEYGNWFGNIDIINKNSINELNDKLGFSLVTKNQIIGFAKLPEDSYKYAPYVYVLGVGDKFKENMPIKLVKGKLPENSLEILMPSHLLSYEDKSYNIGDKIKLKLGYRKLDNKYVGQNTTYKKDEVFEDRIVKNYTIVGIYEYPRFEYCSCPGYTALTCIEPEEQFDGLYDIYFKTDDASNVRKFINDNNFPINKNIKGVIRGNYNLLMYYGQFKYDSLNGVLFSVSAIIICLIMFGSIALIYNSFSMSVSERTKQFGLLSSIGATKRQLKKSILFEAFSLSIIGIPLGILSGIGGIWITLLCVGDKLTTFFNHELPMKLSVSPFAILSAIIITVLTVLISAWIPSKRATKVSAIESIRLNNDIKIKKNRIKSSKLVYKVFKFEGMIANKYYKRSRRKYRATVISLFMSIVLFISAGAFCDSLKRSVNLADNTNIYDIKVNLSNNETNITNLASLRKYKDVYKEIKNEVNVVECSYITKIFRTGYIPLKYFKEDFVKEYVTDSLIEKVNNQKCFKTEVKTIFVDNTTYLNYLDENNLSKKEFYNINNPVAIGYINNKMFDMENQRFRRYNFFNSKILDINTILFKDIEGYYHSYNIKSSDNSISHVVYRSCNEDSFKKLLYKDAIKEKVNNKIRYITNNKSIFIPGDSSFVSIIYPMSYIDKIIPDNNLNKIEILLSSKNHKETVSNIDKILSDSKYNTSLGYSIYDLANENEMARNALLTVNVFSYGFITLITLIAVANVFNTISTNILLRKRDFAMLKSVGLTKRGFNRILRFESILYGTKALAYGLPASIAVTYLINLAFIDAFDIKLVLPYKQILISIISVFVIVFLTMMYSIQKIKKNNLIDDLRNENI